MSLGEWGHELCGLDVATLTKEACHPRRCDSYNAKLLKRDVESLGKQFVVFLI